MLDLVEHVRKLFELMAPVLDERTTRLLAAAVATSLGRGGTKIVTEATGIRTKRIAHGKHDLKELASSPDSPLHDRIRRPGGGRKGLLEIDATVLQDLESLVEPTTRGDPESPLRWTTKSVRQLSAELSKMGHRVGRTMVAELLHLLGYSLQANSKRIEGKQHPDRDAQFRFINKRTREMQRAAQPVISVDTKKKELVGQFANKGREWQPMSEPIDVRVHDFLDDRAVGKAIPYGVYDVGRNEGFVNVGSSHDTGEFAVQSIRTWWKTMGRSAYPDAKEILIVADAGGSNGTRNTLWKTELQRFADETKLIVNVSHMPPGTSKWNKIEHRLFSFISMNWRGKPLESYEAIVRLIGSTTTRTGLKVKARLDRRKYKKGIKVPRAVMKSLAIRRRRFHGDWNYRLHPRSHS
jgi:hypothetical protein